MNSNELLTHDDLELQKQLLIGVGQDICSTLATNYMHYDVVCEDTARQALCACLQARKLKNKIEDSRKEVVRPHIDFQKSVMKFATDLSSKFSEIEQSLHAKIFGWLKDQQENPFTRIDEIEVEDGKLSLKAEWTFEIEDEQAVPREFLCADTDAIKKAVKNGIRCIPGVKISRVETASMRVKN